MNLYDQTAFKSSKIITTSYSTSFSLGIKTLAKKFHFPIYAIYGFVRYADEIVDTFHNFDKRSLLDEFKADMYQAIQKGISMNPVLQSFQIVVNKYGIDHELIDAFLESMEMDLTEKKYSAEDYKKYIFGSAEVVGLMCLKVFCEGDKRLYNELKGPAKSLGSAFQKVNFLRDLKADHEDLSRTYFPNTDLSCLDEDSKKSIIEDIENDFSKSIKGIRELPIEARFGVFMAYRYYHQLLKKLKRTPALKLKSTRIRVPNYKKIELLTRSYVKYQLNLM